MEEEDESRPFLSSSPSNGVDTEKEGWVAKNPGSPYWGDGKPYNTQAGARYPLPITHYISNGLLTQGRGGSKSTGRDGKEVGVGVIKSGGPYWGVGW